MEPTLNKKEGVDLDKEIAIEILQTAILMLQGGSDFYDTNNCDAIEMSLNAVKKVCKVYTM